VVLALGDTSSAVALANESISIGSTEQREAAANHAYVIESKSSVQMRRRLLGRLGFVQYQAGSFSESLTSFYEAETLQAKLQPQFPQLYSTIGFYFSELLQTELERAAWRVQLSLPPKNLSSDLLPYLHKETRRRGMNSLQLVLQGSRTVLDIALNRLTLGRAALYAAIVGLESSHNSDALEQITLADQDFRRSGAAHHVPRGLLSRAWLRAFSGDIEGACEDLEEAWDIAERGRMRLHMTDILLYRARLFFREQSYPWKSSTDDVAAAAQLIDICGYRRRDEELMDARQALA
jgi:hypothetical protein